MEGLNPLPKAISHKDLDLLLKNALKENIISEDLEKEDFIQAKEFRHSLKEWEQQSEKLLNILKKKGSYISEGRDQNSLMALGAMESHLNIALQALKASENN